MKRPLFSIVTPSYNQAEYLEQTIQSVLHQDGNGTDFDIEYFVIDGGSTDHSADVIRAHEAELAGWCSEPDRGQTHAINKGFASARGEIRAYINSDDYYEPRAFSAVMKAFADSRHVDLFYGVCRHVGGSGVAIREQCGSIDSLEGLLDIWNEWLRPFDNRNFVQPEVFWSNRLTERVGEFNERLHYTMDFEYWLRGFDVGMSVQHIDRVLANFRIHEAQKTTSQDNTRLELLDVIEPYLQETDDVRITTTARDRMVVRNRLERLMIESGGVPHAALLTSLARLAQECPSLLREKAYWRHVRRAGKAMLRRKAA